MPHYIYILIAAGIALAIVVNGSYPSLEDRAFGFVQWSLILARGAGVFYCYMIPWRVAKQRGHMNAPAILVLNLLLGWTFIGWAIALIWAMTTSHQNIRS